MRPRTDAFGQDDPADRPGGNILRVDQDTFAGVVLEVGDEGYKIAVIFVLRVDARDERRLAGELAFGQGAGLAYQILQSGYQLDRKSTRLNSSH